MRSHARLRLPYELQIEAWRDQRKRRKFRRRKRENGWTNSTALRTTTCAAPTLPLNVTKLQQCLQFPGRVQAPLGMSDLRQRRDRGKATAMPSVRSSHRSGFLLSSPTVGTRLEIEGTEGSIVGINRSRNGASATTSPSELEWVEIADRR